MAAGDEASAALARCHVVWVPEELDVEGGVGRVGDRVDVEGLEVGGTRLQMVGEVVVERGILADERLDDAADLWQTEVVADR